MLQSQKSQDNFNRGYKITLTVRVIPRTTLGFNGSLVGLRELWKDCFITMKEYKLKSKRKETLRLESRSYHLKLPVAKGVFANSILQKEFCKQYLLFPIILHMYGHMVTHMKYGQSAKIS